MFLQPQNIIFSLIFLGMLLQALIYDWRHYKLILFFFLLGFASAWGGEPLPLLLIGPILGSVFYKKIVYRISDSLAVITSIVLLFSAIYYAFPINKDGVFSLIELGGVAVSLFTLILTLYFSLFYGSEKHVNNLWGLFFFNTVLLTIYLNLNSIVPVMMSAKVTTSFALKDVASFIFLGMSLTFAIVNFGLMMMTPKKQEYMENTDEDYSKFLLANYSQERPLFIVVSALVSIIALIANNYFDFIAMETLIFAFAVFLVVLSDIGSTKLSGNSQAV